MRRFESVEKLIERHGLIRLSAGERIVIFDPDGNRMIWRVANQGLFAMEPGRSDDGRWQCAVLELKTGAQYSERGGPPYRWVNCVTLTASERETKPAPSQQVRGAGLNESVSSASKVFRYKKEFKDETA